MGKKRTKSSKEPEGKVSKLVIRELHDLFLNSDLSGTEEKESKSEPKEQHWLQEILRQKLIDLNEVGYSYSEIAEKTELTSTSLSRFVNKSNDLTLGSACKVIEKLGPNLAPVNFVSGMLEFQIALIDLINKAQSSIKVIGARSRSNHYLKTIEKKLIESDGEIEYKRFICGQNISHEIHLHLKNIILMKNVEVHENKSPLFANMTIVDETDCLIVLPTAKIESVYAITIFGARHTKFLAEYFESVFNTVPINLVDENNLDSFCEICGKAGSGF